MLQLFMTKSKTLHNSMLDMDNYLLTNKKLGNSQITLQNINYFSNCFQKVNLEQFSEKEAGYLNMIMKLISNSNQLRKV